jgi:hypothetical protein
MTSSRPQTGRRGAVLSITASLCALLVVLTLAFLATMRADAQATAISSRQAQSRILLMAACNYVLEAGRIGWGREVFGWIDVRDGKLGPKALMTNVDDDSNFPIGRAVRFPLHCWERPPFAISPQDPNPIDAELTADGKPTDAITFGQPYLSNPDPLVPATAATEALWRSGDARARPETLAMGWFRLYRDGPATFVVTCGSGGTYGFKDWNDVDPVSRADLFASSQELFDQLLAAEIRLCYRIEWSPAVSVSPEPNLTTGVDTYAWYPSYGSSARQARGSVQPGRDNVCGTIQWVQRLRFPPDLW